MPRSYTARTPADLADVAREILETKPRLLSLVGPLGAGKTTFTQALGKLLGIQQQVTSPTYVLQQVYRAHGHPAYDTLVHVDAYRLRSERELPALDLEHWAQQPRTLVVIEWADRIEKHLAGLQPVWVTFSVHGEERNLTVR
jgi:tRNA threonylcarbamoyladenosine biosynthesis protein TsaE